DHYAREQHVLQLIDLKGTITAEPYCDRGRERGRRLNVDVDGDHIHNGSPRTKPVPFTGMLSGKPPPFQLGSPFLEPAGSPTTIAFPRDEHEKVGCHRQLPVSHRLSFSHRFALGSPTCSPACGSRCSTPSARGREHLHRGGRS